MSVLIKGLAMPKGCNVCKCVISVGGPDDCDEICAFTGKSVQYFSWPKLKKNRPQECPIVEAPEPHGRLIDADKLKDKINIAFLSEIGKIIDEAPTVIESEANNAQNKIR